VLLLRDGEDTEWRTAA